MCQDSNGKSLEIDAVCSLIRFGVDSQVYKGQKHNIDSYSAFFDNCKANDTGLTKQLEDAGVTDVYCSLAIVRLTPKWQLGQLLFSTQLAL